jgi:hypothetical protein
MKDIYNLELHEWIEVKNNGVIVFVFRVPGGWLYRFGNPFDNTVEQCAIQ